MGVGQVVRAARGGVVDDVSSTAAGGLRQLLISPTDMHGFEHLFTRM